MSHSHSQLRDPAIKLFGRNIPLPDPDIPAIHLQSMDERIEATKSQDGDAVEKPCEQDSFSESDNGQENEAEASRVAEEDVGAESDKCGKEKALKKPDRLIPCPRCNSLETKFCYFNNYNVNQPRHFCKNCHRYWTAGGTIRNVPVGTGRRRNAKHSSSQPRQAPKSPNTAVAALGENCRNGVLPSSDSPLCDSMESKLNLKDPKRADAGSAVDGDCCESSSSSAAATSGDNEDSPAENVDPSQSFPVPQWAYPWSPGFNVVMVGPNNSYYPSPVMTVPGCCSPSVPFSFVPGSYWGYVPSCEAGKWISPVLGPVGSVSPSCSTSNNGCLSNVSPALGKHSRDVSSKTDESTEKCLWVPKTLRIDNPNEAAKSSIWSTLGIEPDRNQGFKRSGIFKPFNKRKSDANPRKTDSDQVLQSNPAALSRSHSFQEST